MKTDTQHKHAFGAPSNRTQAPTTNPNPEANGVTIYRSDHRRFLALVRSISEADAERLADTIAKRWKSLEAQAQKGGHNYD